ncbi:uncharacterized protein LOC135344453 isoform X2 [Halichondria panicea]|uniref:uncharacterized protein LOC135344453 isoform X2 n=1 Tax=Halichondria panicea TaxID=6063 RepID=UPI00312B3E0C
MYTVIAVAARASRRTLLIKPLCYQPQSVRALSVSWTVLADEPGASHFKNSAVKHPLSNQLSSDENSPVDPRGESYSLPHPIWNAAEVDGVEVTHKPPTGKVDKAAFYCMKLLRLGFDLFSGYGWGKWMNTLDEKQWLTRVIFLETVAGVPGMMGAMIRHMKSLRYMERDNGWIHTLLEEAENERMHLLTFLELRRPGPLFRAMVMGGQGVFVSMFGVAYVFSPRFCHRFVGYLEEEAVITYTHCIQCMDEGSLPMWSKMSAPSIAVNYWKLKSNASCPPPYISPSPEALSSTFINNPHYQQRY